LFVHKIDSIFSSENVIRNKSGQLSEQFMGTLSFPSTSAQKDPNPTPTKDEGSTTWPLTATQSKKARGGKPEEYVAVDQIMQMDQSNLNLL
jgi:hypothetical protein